MPTAFAATEARDGGGPPSLASGSARVGSVPLRRLARRSFRGWPGFAWLRGRSGLAAAVGGLLLAGSPAGASEGGLVLVPDPRMLAVLLLFFVLLVRPVNALLLRPVFRVLDDREGQIAGTRQRADKVRADAEEILARYEQAVRDVRDEAERDRKQRLLAARSETAAQTATARAAAEQDLDRARREIAEALANARQSLPPHAERLAREAAARVIGRSLS